MTERITKRLMKLALDLAVGEAAAPKEAGGAHQAPPVKLHLRHGTHQAAQHAT